MFSGFDRLALAYQQGSPLTIADQLLFPIKSLYTISRVTLTA